MHSFLKTQVPYFFDRGNKITESRAIIKYLCRTRKPELLGKTLEVQTKIDMLDYFIYDLLEIGLVPAAYYYTVCIKNTFLVCLVEKLDISEF